MKQGAYLFHQMKSLLAMLFTLYLKQIVKSCKKNRKGMYIPIFVFYLHVAAVERKDDST